jgi:hypothetical protein
LDVPVEVLAGRGGSRISWLDVPLSVCARAEEWLGSKVLGAESRPGGFSPGLASVLVTADGRRLFAKAAGPIPNDIAPRIHRREISIAERLPASAFLPELRWSLDDPESGWVVLLFGEIQGSPPRLPWQSSELEQVLRGLTTITESLTPSPLPLEIVGSVRDSGLLADYWTRLSDEPSRLDDWSRRNLERLVALENRAPSAVAGETLLHLDVRADNILLTPDSMAVVDWPHARQGAAWLDLVFFAPSVAMQGGPQPEDLLRLYPGEPPEAGRLLPALAAIAGFFTWGALQPPPPGLPFLRQFQAAQGLVARNWLAHKLA